MSSHDFGEFGVADPEFTDFTHIIFLVFDFISYYLI